MTVSSGVSAAGIRQSVEAVVTQVLEHNGLDPDVDLFDQGVTSLAFIRIVAQLNEQYDVKLDVAELEEASITSLSALVGAQVGGKNH
ncbi:acyl carrier protein [Streptomyces sp. SAI-135]|jgi:acyl carrier protein|uniref:acyl carrier protein n=1 Tax=Streptomyces TaxID=1883 RepID=UPI001C63DABC|nr:MULTISPECIES: acyl carrier protein [Streptomyces]MDH6521868.1 acyl carrier protein [Streptomyces sp. SAI-090]MDH6573234.1 acyl carrier protein [Streptomyces sp. SAI-117]MDH6614031.1 acyl carrier protein [Streptomyces sp. SAI-135]